MMKFATKLAAAVLAIGLGLGSLVRPADAAPITTINATVAVGTLGTSIAPAGLIDVGTVFTIPVSQVSDSTGDLAGLTVGSALATAPVTATFGTAVSFTSDWGNFTGSVVAASLSFSSGNRVVSIAALGTFTPLGAFSHFDESAMSIIFSMTQPSVGGSVSASFSLASPPTVTVPEPMSLSLFGASLLAFGMARRARRQDQRLDA